MKSKGEILHEADYHEQGHYELNTVKNLHGGHNIDNRRPQEERWVRTRPASGRHRIKRPWIPQWVVNFLFPMSLLWQLLTILILYLTMNHSDDRIVKIGEIVITAFQVAHPIPPQHPQHPTTRLTRTSTGRTCGDDDVCLCETRNKVVA